MTVCSPLSGSSRVRFLRRYPSTELCARWQLKLVHVFYEPLAAYHVDWYVQLQMERFWKLPHPHRSLAHKIIYKLAEVLKDR